MRRLCGDGAAAQPVALGAMLSSNGSVLVSQPVVVVVGMVAAVSAWISVVWV